MSAFLPEPSPFASKHDPVWLKDLRRTAFQWISERGFPTPMDEAWRYIRVTRILEIPFEPAEPLASHA